METVRNGQKVAPYCSECGCRLNITFEMGEWLHYEHFEGRTLKKDARGCQCPVVNLWWWTNEVPYGR